MGLRETILSIDDLPVKSVDVPVWGPVTLKTLSAADRDKVMEFKDSHPTSQWFAYVATLAVVDQAGQRVFNPDDVEPLAAKSAEPLKAVFGAVMSMLRIDDAGVDEIEKKSEATS